MIRCAILTFVVVCALGVPVAPAIAITVTTSGTLTTVPVELAAFFNAGESWSVTLEYKEPDRLSANGYVFNLESSSVRIRVGQIFEVDNTDRSNQLHIRIINDGPNPTLGADDIYNVDQNFDTGELLPNLSVFDLDLLVAFLPDAFSSSALPDAATLNDAVLISEAGLPAGIFVLGFQLTGQGQINLIGVPDSIVAIPEPSTALLLGLGLVGLGAAGKRR